MLQKSICNGITQALEDYAKANNKYMKDQCNPDETRTYLQYLDVNNLYGWAMIQKLPTHGFAREKVDDFTPEKIYQLVKKDKQGYILQVNAEFQKGFTRSILSCHI